MLDSRLSEDVQDIRQSQKIHHGSHEKLISEIESRRKNFSRSDDSERYLQRRFTFAITFVIAMMLCKCTLRKCTKGFKIYKVAENINQFMFMDDIKLFAKNQKELEILI